MKIDVSVRKIRGYINFSRQATDRAVEESRADIVDWNVDQMYEQGVTADNKPLGEYAPSTIAIKRQKGQKTDHVTLRDTGDFHSEMVVKKEGVGKFTVTSEDWKAGTLEQNYGNIFGLTPPNEAELAKDMTETLYKELKQYWK